MKTDKGTINLIIGAATLTGWGCVGAGVGLFLMALRQQEPSIAALIGGAAGTLVGAGPSTLTGLLALLAKTSTGETQGVTVENTPADPVPTAPQAAQTLAPQVSEAADDPDRTQEIP